MANLVIIHGNLAIWKRKFLPTLLEIVEHEKNAINGWSNELNERKKRWEELGWILWEVGRILSVVTGIPSLGWKTLWRNKLWKWAPCWDQEPRMGVINGLNLAEVRWCGWENWDDATGYNDPTSGSRDDGTHSLRSDVRQISNSYEVVWFFKLYIISCSLWFLAYDLELAVFPNDGSIANSPPSYSCRSL